MEDKKTNEIDPIILHLSLEAIAFEMLLEEVYSLPESRVLEIIQDVIDRLYQ